MKPKIVIGTQQQQQLMMANIKAHAAKTNQGLRRITTPAACDAKFARALRMELEQPDVAVAGAAEDAHDEL